MQWVGSNVPADRMRRVIRGASTAQAKRLKKGAAKFAEPRVAGVSATPTLSAAKHPFIQVRFFVPCGILSIQRCPSIQAKLTQTAKSPNPGGLRPVRSDSITSQAA